MRYAHSLFNRLGHALRHDIGAPDRRAALAATAILLLSLLFLVTADDWYEEQLRLQLQAETGEEVRAYGRALTTVISSRLSRLQGLASFVIAAEDEEVIRSDFETYASGLSASLRGIHYMALVPSGVVEYVYTPSANRDLLGQVLTLTSDQAVQAALAKAIASEETVVVGPLTLANGELGILGLRAIYRDGAYWGHVQIGLELMPLFDAAGLGTAAPHVDLALRDAHARVFLGDYTLFARSPATTEIAIADERWTLAIVPTGGWDEAIANQLRLARIASLLVIGLLTAVVYLAVDRQARLRRAVAARTQELAEAHQLLEERVEERTHELQTLLDVSRNVASTLELPALLSLLLDQLRQVVDFDSLALYLRREEDQLELAHYYGSSAPQQKEPVWLQYRQILTADLNDLRQPLILPAVGLAAGERWQHLFGERLAAAQVQATSWMAVPLLLKNRLVGLLLFQHSTTNYYTARHGQLALAMANHVAVAIENARLYEQAHSLAALQERQKLARELHDSVSQALYGISLGTRTVLTLVEQSGETVPAGALQQPLEYTLGLARAALMEMRALIFELRPESLAVDGLIPALIRCSDVLQARHQLDVHTDFGPEPELPVADKEALYRVAQEALHNVAKHAEATHASVSLATVDDEIILEIEDDGIGFDPQGQFPGHLGLQSMRERVEGIGGTLLVESTPAAGTLIRACIPGQPR